MVRKLLPLCAAVAMAMPLMSGIAKADTTITFGGSIFTDGSEGVTLYGTRVGSPESVSAGGFTAQSVMPVDPGEYPNLFFCTDISVYLANSDTYKIGSLADTGLNHGTLTTLQQNRISALMLNEEPVVGSASGSTQAVASAALQIAIWAVLYDSGSATAYNVTSDTTFNIGGSGNSDGVASLANTLLCNVTSTCAGTANWSSTNGSYSVVQFEPTGGTSQTLTYIQNGGSGNNSVTTPEPASLALIGVGLAGLAFARRKRG